MTGDWQQRFNRIPQRFRQRIARLDQNDFKLYTVRELTRAEVAAGNWSHLGIAVDAAGDIVVPPRWLPEEAAGRAAHRNRHGYEITRRDLPKETRYNTTESPNWGDADRNGTHTSYLPYKRYPRDFVPPDGTEIAMNVVESTADTARVAFEIDAVFDRTAADLDAPLLRAMSLLQESVGEVRVRASNEPVATYAQAVQVDWEILPPGDRDEIVQQVVDRVHPTPPQRVILEERLDFLIGLQPARFITGHSGFARYVGAQFADDLVVFENINYGNAVYIMFEDWPTLSTRSRLELMAGNTDDFARVVHAAGWEQRVAAVVNEKLGRP
jgi:hypothetical protein